MSVRERRLKEQLKSAVLAMESARNELNRAGFKGLALEAEILEKKIARVQGTMTGATETHRR